MLKHKVIVDFDNTFFEDGCDVDDALALRYLLNCENVQIIAVCTTYGNSSLDVVNANTCRLFDEWGISIPIYIGTPKPVRLNGASSQPLDSFEISDASEASSYIVQMLTNYPGQIDILALGSTSNLGQAVLKSFNTTGGNILNSARSITLMGGITEPLIINDKIMNELNFSCDPLSTQLALSSTAPTTISTAHNCLPAFFTREDFIENFGETSELYLSCIAWFDQMRQQYSWDGWTCWDVVAAAHLAHPEFFNNCETNVLLSEHNFNTGFLETNDATQVCSSLPNENLNATFKSINLPKIKDANQFKEHVINNWH